MQQQHTNLSLASEPAGRVVVLEAEPGQARQGVLRQWLNAAQQSGAATWLLSCAFEEGGVWAGLADLVQEVIPHIQQTAPDLIDKHSYELCVVLPALRRHIAVRNLTLTDTATGEEKTRLYPLERVYRSLHGLIDLLVSWHQLCGGVPWVIACDHYDRASSVIHRFWADLMRRRGQQLQLSLLVATAPGQSAAAVSRFEPTLLAQTVRLDLPSDAGALVAKEQMTQWARELEQQVEQDAIAQEMHLPRLIHYWQQSETPEKALRWQVRAMQLYVDRGLCEAAFVYGASVEANLDRLYVEDKSLHDVAVQSLFFCCVLLRDVERAHRVLQEKMRDRMDDPAHLVRTYYYQMAMLHARHFRTPDLDKAEEYLERGLAILSDLDLPDDERHFLTVFIGNGLALVRLRQGRPQEALALCRAGLTHLSDHLRPDQHRLHRSVLLYNIAQVYAARGPYEDAIVYFTATIDMDPNYAEYYAERGNVYVKMDRLDDAVHDYLRAIELCPGYAEAWTNVGQCYRAQGRMHEAVEAYSSALDLDPTVTLSLIGRAEAYAALGQPEEALADYDAALTLDPAQPLILASRAIVHHEAGRVLAALRDLDEAIALSAQTPDLYQNRAVALTGLGRWDEAAQDLRTYLRLCPDAEDRTDVEHKLSLLLVGEGTSGKTR
jgi:tetratricopeptide (TPR) repeat protein